MKGQGANMTHNGCLATQVATCAALFLEKHIQEQTPEQARSKRYGFISTPCEIPLASYLGRFSKYTPLEPSTYLYAVALYIKAQETDPVLRLTKHNVHRLTATCLLLAMKMQEDNPLAEKTFGTLAGVSTRELARMEISLLTVLEFNCSIQQQLVRNIVGTMAAEADSSARDYFARLLEAMALQLQIEGEHDESALERDEPPPRKAQLLTIDVSEAQRARRLSDEATPETTQLGTRTHRWS